MEENINIVAILKDKKNGIRLYSPIFGECTFCCVREDTNDICVKKHNGVKEYFNSEGLYFALGEVMLFPSKSIRDWEKFSWKRGDILVNSSGFKLFFDRWANDDYTRFFGKVNILEDSFSYETEKYTLASKEETLDTLEIEKTQPEFKDGDIVFVESHMLGINTSSIITAIFRKEKENDKYKFSPALCESNVHDTYLREFPVVLSPSDIKTFRLATEEEKKQFFSALANKGKAWDSEKKKVVNLKPKFDELKPFDKVVVRCSEADRWSIDFFSYKVHNGYICTGDAWFGYCLPYNEETAHLLGTTDEWKGGEG